MLALVAIATGLLLVGLLGGSLRALGEARVRGELMILALFLVQAVARGSAGRVGSLGLIIWAGCSVALLLLMVVQIRVPGLALAALGIGLNALVVLLNSGMPVVPPPGSEGQVAAAVSASAGFYHVADARTVLPVLGDVLPAGAGIASIGDVLLALGVCIFIVDRGTQSIVR